MRSDHPGSSEQGNPSGSSGLTASRSRSELPGVSFLSRFACGPRVLLTLGLQALVLLGCDSDPGPPPIPFSEECDACLSRGACEEAFVACTDDEACKEHVRCMLQARCYTEPPESDCEAQNECALPDGADEARTLALDFETCARTECADICAFAEP